MSGGRLPWLDSSRMGRHGPSSATPRCVVVWAIPLVAPVALIAWLAWQNRARHLAHAGVRFPVDADADQVTAAIGHSVEATGNPAPITLAAAGPRRWAYSTPGGDRGTILVEPAAGPTCTVIARADYLAPRARPDTPPSGAAARAIAGLVDRWGRVAPGAPEMVRFQASLATRIARELSQPR